MLAVKKKDKKKEVILGSCILKKGQTVKEDVENP